MILMAGVPRTSVSRPNACWQFGQMPNSLVKSLLIRSLKHFTSDPFPPLRYLYTWVLQLEQ
jgi:hypothetical protein